MKMTRAERVGRLMAKAIIEMVHLMYQNNTALNFMKGLTAGLNKELVKRQAQK